MNKRCQAHKIHENNLNPNWNEATYKLWNWSAWIFHDHDCAGCRSPCHNTGAGCGTIKDNKGFYVDNTIRSHKHLQWNSPSSYKSRFLTIFPPILQFWHFRPLKLSQATIILNGLPRIKIKLSINKNKINNLINEYWIFPCRAETEIKKCYGGKI